MGQRVEHEMANTTRPQYNAVIIRIVWMILLGQMSRHIAHDSNVLSRA
jgi:hypothetical protein